VRRVRGLKTLRRFGRWAQSRVRPSCIVLGYHRVADATSDLFEQCVSPRNFDEQMEVLRRIANPLPLEDLVQRVTAGELPPRAVGVTFDDAYADLGDHAIPSLRRVEVPATVFAVSAMLGKQFWWDRLESSWGSKRSIAEDPELQRLHYRLRCMGPEERDQVLLELESCVGDVRRPGPRAATADELRTMSAEPLIDIGAHTRTHEWLPSLSPEARWEEVAGSKVDLERTLGGTVSGFAFPYGDESPTLAAEVQEAGFRFACGSRSGVLCRGDDVLMIPRWWVGNERGSAFERRLRRWL
jgi:peptidoglycan/xylan/chitin deacetylase (PgdA/CDA1 family)